MIPVLGRDSEMASGTGEVPIKLYVFITDKLYINNVKEGT